MATELGKAYVQIMPSAKGISGSIQKALGPEATRAGKSAGASIANSISQTMGKMGSTLTKAITLPALGAATAIGGITAALGWQRLTGVDNARAKLEGLGYAAKDVERISGQVTTAIATGMTTMAEGTDIAAGALAAGVKEGKELERYIKLVGDAAVGSQRPVEDMAMIFNRVEGSGKLMTQELNMVEQGMPGFAKAMADSLGVSTDKFREMVTDGKVSSDQFLDVMDDFAGGMAEAYAGTWSGMVANTKAWVGIIGETMLGGVFEKSKESIAQFIEFLQSDAVVAWAEKAGAKIGDTFSNMVDHVKSAIDWWVNLDDSTKKLIGKIAGIAIAAGPVLLILSKIIGAIVPLIGAFKIVGGAIAALISPIGLIVAAVVAAGILIYQNWELIKEKAVQVFEAFAPLIDMLKESFFNMLESVAPIMEKLKQLWESLLPILEIIGAVVGGVLAVSFGIIISLFNATVVALGPLIEAVISLADFVVNSVNLIIAVLTGDFAGAMEFWNAMVESSVEFFISLFDALVGFVMTFVDTIIGFFQSLYMTLVGNSIIPDMVNGIVNWFKNLFKWAIDLVKNITDGIVAGFNFMKNTVMGVIDAFKNIIKAGLDYVKNTFINILAFLKGLVTGDFGAMKQAVSNQVQNIKNTIKNIFGSLPGVVSGAFSKVGNAVKNGMTTAFNNVKNFFGKFKSAGANIVGSIADGIKGAIGKVTGAIGNVASKVRNFLPFSPPKEGPLMDIMDVKWGETIAGGIDKGGNDVANAMDDVLNFDLTRNATFSNANTHAAQNGQDVTVLLKELIKAVKDGRDFIVDGDVLGSTLDRRFVNKDDIESYLRGDRS